MKVNIYLETDKQSQECMQRKYGYVIETIFKGAPITREGEALREHITRRTCKPL